MAEEVNVSTTLPGRQQSSPSDGTGHWDTTHYHIHFNPAFFCFFNLHSFSVILFLTLSCDEFTNSHVLKSAQKSPHFAASRYFVFVLSIQKKKGFNE